MEYERGKLFVSFDCQWMQVFGGYNWYTFTFLQFEIENDIVLGGYEIILYVLGFGVRIRWNHTETEAMKSIIRDVEIITNENNSRDN